MAPTSEKKQGVASQLTGQSSNHNQVRSESIVRFARKETIWCQQQFWGANQMSCWLQELGVDSSVLLSAGWGSSGGGILQSMPDSMLSKSVRDSCGKYRQAAGSSSEMLSIKALSLAPDLCVNTFIALDGATTMPRKHDGTFTVLQSLRLQAPPCPQFALPVIIPSDGRSHSARCDAVLQQLKTLIIHSCKSHPGN